MSRIDDQADQRIDDTDRRDRLIWQCPVRRWVGLEAS